MVPRWSSRRRATALVGRAAERRAVGEEVAGEEVAGEAVAGGSSAVGVGGGELQEDELCASSAEPSL